jgi:hypothetical protein
MMKQHLPAKVDKALYGEVRFYIWRRKVNHKRCATGFCCKQMEVILIKLHLFKTLSYFICCIAVELSTSPHHAVINKTAASVIAANYIL